MIAGHSSASASGESSTPAEKLGSGAGASGSTTATAATAGAGSASVASSAETAAAACSARAVACSGPSAAAPGSVVAAATGGWPWTCAVTATAVRPAAAAVSAELATDADPAPAVAAVAVVEPDAPAPEPSFSAGVELSPEALAELWPAIIESLGEDAPMLAAALHEARPAGLGDGELTVAWPESAGFSKRKADDPASKETIARVIRAVTGSSLRLAFELRDEATLAAQAPATPQLSEEELVNRFVEEFDAEVLPPEEEST